MLLFDDGHDAEDFLEGGVAGFDFFPAALAEGSHALFAGGLGEGAGALAFQDELVELVVEAENLEETDAAAVAGAAAAVAADGVLERGDEFGLGGVAFEDGERLEELDLANGLGGAAVRAEAADEALGDDELDGGGDEEGSMPMSTRRVIAPGASLVCKVENTK